LVLFCQLLPNNPITQIFYYRKKIHEIRGALKELEMWLKEMMEKHKMFGAKEEAELL